MECNKDEAIRAKELAETKMQNKDFIGAKKIALKAQRLFTDLENISQMISVCDVHCCANSKINGETDWYGILQVDQTADDSSIKKQYRKLALQLHPDKNKFPGAESAFKLIGEANLMLADRAKRSFYDMKRRCAVPKVVPRPPAPQQQSYMANTTRSVPRPPAPQQQSNTARNVSQNASTFSKANPPSLNAQNPFWTSCPSCFSKFEYIRMFLNMTLRCQKCMNNFVAIEIPHPTQNFGSQPNQYFGLRPNQQFGQFNQNFGIQPNQHFGPQSNQNFGVRLNQHFGSQSNQNFGFRPTVNFGPQKFTAQLNVDHKLKQEAPVKINTKKDTNVSANEQKARASTTNKQKKRKRKRAVVDSSESDCSADSEEEEEEEEEMDFDNLVYTEEQNGSARYPKRSCRTSQNVKYNEHANEDDNDSVSPKRPRKVEVSDSNAASAKKKEENLPNGEASNSKKEEETPDVTVFSSPDSEFFDFDKERDPKQFEPEQIWAVYDDNDAMPRFYVRIKEVTHPFKVRFTWLEHNPTSEPEQLWTKKGLPVACGNYVLGSSETTKSVELFSHKIFYDKGIERKTFNVYPLKGEVWALFKGWDETWPFNTDNHSSFKYEFVEVVADSSQGFGLSVVPLVKAQGFVSLFVVSTERKFQIPPSQMLRFSHRVPAYRIPENDKNVPEGSFELDTAALPGNRLENEFCDFSITRSIKKIKAGQIWALYSDIDQYPKYYAKIKKTDCENNTITASWVELQCSRDDEKSWSKRGLPATIGVFKVDRKSVTFSSIALFSHIVRTTLVEKRKYAVYPHEGEVWAMYKDWSVVWTEEDVRKCEYIPVEILECSNAVKARVLSRVDGCNFVFKAEVKGGEEDMVVELNDGLRFSHQIPAFKLTDEGGGVYRGCWELDSLAVPNFGVC